MKRFISLFAFVLCLCAVPSFAAHHNDVTLNQGGSAVAASQQCSASQPCTMQLFSLKGPCPATVGNGTWTSLGASFAPSGTTANSSIFTFSDTSVVSGQVTCYYATVTFTSGGAASSPSNMFSATTPTDPPAAGTLSVVAN